MPAFPIGGPEFQRGHEFTLAFELRARHDPRLAAIGTVDSAGTQAVTEYSIQRSFRHSVELRGVPHALAPLWTPGRQQA
jgi:hypothetical protein